MLLRLFLVFLGRGVDNRKGETEYSAKTAGPARIRREG
jgi:hypothetical protein